jgi:putative zinc finger protein
MVVTCEQVWREVSNYLEGEIDPALRVALEGHVKQCKRCTAVLDGTRNVVRLYADGRMFQLPLGFSGRLRRRLAAAMPRPRGTGFGWLVAVAAAALISGSVAVANSGAFQHATPRTEHAREGKEIPARLMVIVAEDGKTFHVPGCRFIHEKQKLRTVTAQEAIREGYVPCIRCMHAYLENASLKWNSEKVVTSWDTEKPY